MEGEKGIVRASHDFYHKSVRSPNLTLLTLLWGEVEKKIRHLFGNFSQLADPAFWEPQVLKKFWGYFVNNSICFV